jgi:hypothetical protein
MYRLNFYNPSTLPTNGAYNPMFRNGIMLRAPQEVRVEVTTFSSDSDSFSDNPTRFERALHEEVKSLKARSKILDEQIKTIDKLAEADKEKIVQEYSAIQNAKETLALFVQEIQKCTNAILANFR